VDLSTLADAGLTHGGFNGHVRPEQSLDQKVILT
jgi:hypothetical protein